MTENARNALPAKHRAELLRRKLDDVEDDNMIKVSLLKELKAVDTFLESSSYNPLLLEEEAITSTISALEQLLTFSPDPHVSKEVNALAEELYTLFTFEQFQRVALEFEKRSAIFRKALAAKKRCELLKHKIACIKGDDVKVGLLKALNAVDTFLASAYNAFVLKEEVVFDMIFNIQKLLTLAYLPFFSHEIYALAEEFYTVFPLDHSSVELELEKRGNRTQLFAFRYEACNLQNSLSCLRPFLTSHIRVENSVRIQHNLPWSFLENTLQMQQFKVAHSQLFGGRCLDEGNI